MIPWAKRHLTSSRYILKDAGINKEWETEDEERHQRLEFSIETKKLFESIVLTVTARSARQAYVMYVDNHLAHNHSLLCVSITHPLFFYPHSSNPMGCRIGASASVWGAFQYAVETAFKESL